jgi:Ni/Fe-hydrogenase 1 B-type cytochrome subunit
MFRLWSLKLELAISISSILNASFINKYFSNISNKINMQPADLKISHPSITFNEPHSLSIRIWHWVTYLTLTASLTCVLLGSTLFKTNDNITMVQGQLQEKGAVVTKDQARAVAHEYSDKVWNWHKFIGYGLCFLLLSRLVIEITQPTEEKLKVKIKRVLGFAVVTEDDKKEKGHYLFVKRGYQFFYLSLSIMGLTGLGLAFEDVPLFKDWHKGITQIHTITQYFIYAYILLHLIGVIRADAGKHKGIVSGMINGRQ